MASGPNFSDLGVIDPTTGRPVHLSSSEIANVMGATGGVAPTKFQAATEGFFQGVGQGQQIVGNISAVQAQQANIDQSRAATEAQDIQNDIARQTKEATIQARNNQIKQESIQAQIKTDKLTADNMVLDAVRSGDPAKLADVISNPQTMLSAIEQDQYVQAAYGKLKAAGSFTPQQIAAFDKFNTTRDIYKAGPLQDAYQTSAAQVTGSLPFQQLQQMSGLDSNQLLSTMKIQQAQTPWGPATVLAAPDGSHVVLDDKDKDKDNQIFSGFFSARDRLQNAGRYKLPLDGSTPASAAVDLKPQSNLPLSAVQSAQTPPGGAPAPAQGAAPTEAPVAALPPDTSGMTQGVNPNGVSPLGVPLQTKIPQLGNYNTKTTPSGVPLQADLTKRAQEIFSQAPRGSMTISQAYNVAAKEVLKKAPLSVKAAETVSNNSILADKKLTMAQEIRAVVTDAEEAGLALGPTWGDSLSRVTTSVDTVFDSELNEQVGDVKSRMSDLEGRHVILSMQGTGMGVRAFDSEKESERLLKTGPTLTATPKQLLAVADRYEAEAKQIQDENTLAQFFDVQGLPLDQSKRMVAEYFSNPANKARVFDEATNSFIINRNKEDPLKWANKKLGIDEQQAASEVFSTPTDLPKSPTVTQPPAAGSGTATPFAPAKKDNTSAFPSPQGSPEIRGANYNATPATLKDLKAIAETASSGGNIRQFQAGGSVPVKMDKATPDLVARVIGAEALPGKTKGSVKVNSVSPTGVKGIMQVTQSTFKEQAPGAEIALTDRTDPLQSVVAGTQYLNKMLKRFDGNVDLALAAYNAGPGTVETILDRKGLSVARTTIDMIANDLPDTQPTAAYVKQITSRGRVAPKTEQQKGNGFFDNFNVQDLNPFKVATAEAQNAVSPVSPQGAVLPTGGASLDAEGPQPVGMKVDPSTTDSQVEVPSMDTSPRGDIPPVSELTAALAEDVNIATSALPTAGRAVKFIRNSAVGRWLGEVKETQGFKVAEVYANAATFGLYDEGLGTLESSMGFDGKLMTNQIRADLKEARREMPKTSMALDILGSVSGGVGAGMVLRALRGGIAAAKLAPMTVREGVKIGGGQGAARGFGEGESVGQRVLGTAAGGTVGGVLGGAAGIIPKIPVVGAPAVAGGAAGALIGGVTGGSGSDVVEGAAIGAGVGMSAAVATKFSPLIQKAITSTVAHLNTYKGLQTLGAMVQKLLTGKTPAETAADLTGSEALIMDQLQHLPRGQLKAMLTELSQSKNPQIPARLFDVLKDADTNTLVKVMGQLKGNKEVSAKINQFLTDRMSGQNARIAEEVGPQELVEQSARRVIGLIEGKVKGAKTQAIDASKSIYASAKETTPFFDSPKIKEILSTPAMRDAVSAARRDVEATIPKGTQDSGLITDISNKMFDRVRTGQSIDDLVELGAKDSSKLADNSFDILTEARRKLGQQLEDPSTSNSLKRELGILHKDLTTEMNRLSPGDKGFEGANAAFSAQMAKVDTLTKSSQIDALRDLADGNVNLALGKIMRMPPTDLEKLINTVDDPQAFQDLARGFLRQKLDTARGSGDVASKLVSKGEWKNLETLLGKEEAASMRAMIDAESKIAKSGRSVTGGSDTVPKAQAAQTLDELSGQGNAPLQTASSMIGTTIPSTILRSIKTVLGTFAPKGNPEAVAELADTLVLSAPKGIQAMEKILKARGFEAAELRRMRPYLQEWQDALRGGGAGVTTSLTGQVQANTKPQKKKK